jgi:hypothetical protein
MPPNELNERIQAISTMLKLFRAERVVYLTINVLSLVVLLSCAIYLLFKGTDMLVLIGLFSSSGGITIATGRVIKMWTDAMRMLVPTGGKEGES